MNETNLEARVCETCEFFAVFDHLMSREPARICLEMCQYWTEETPDSEAYTYCDSWSPNGSFQ